MKLKMVRLSNDQHCIFTNPNTHMLLFLALDKARGKLGTEMNSNLLSRQEPLKATVSSQGGILLLLLFIFVC